MSFSGIILPAFICSFVWLLFQLSASLFPEPEPPSNPASVYDDDDDGYISEPDDDEGIDLSKINIPNITPLRNDQGLEAWKRNVNNMAHLMGWTKLLEGTAVPPPARASAKSRNKYRVKNAIVYIAITKSLEPVMDILRLYGWEDDGTFNVKNLFDSITRWHYLVSKLREAGLTLDDKLLQANLLKGLIKYDKHWVLLGMAAVAYGGNKKSGGSGSGGGGGGGTSSSTNNNNNNNNNNSNSDSWANGKKCGDSNCTILYKNKLRYLVHAHCKQYYSGGDDACFLIHPELKKAFDACKVAQGTANRAVLNFNSGVIDGVNTGSASLALDTDFLAMTVIDVASFDKLLPDALVEQGPVDGGNHDSGSVFTFNEPLPDDSVEQASINPDSGDIIIKLSVLAALTPDTSTKITRDCHRIPVPVSGPRIRAMDLATQATYAYVIYCGCEWCVVFNGLTDLLVNKQNG
ncbi:hypothetical protein N658DRAFT_560145 [Parathielavia hyrcaniae]|uniref:Uncharacterized protein n=1 Tax=Parathielavia hyrcaniae TaxID=113614 RepID=A0AAN6Q036_9PEZI|nr:hypothetical protein N658DRAFT_560145 [Parathielavia hyrcaniae]